MISQETIGEIFIFADQPEQQVLGFNRRASELAGLVASEEYNPPCSFSISFEHSLLILSCSRNQCMTCLELQDSVTPLLPLVCLLSQSALRFRGCLDFKRS